MRGALSQSLAALVATALIGCAPTKHLSSEEVVPQSSPDKVTEVGAHLQKIATDGEYDPTPLFYTGDYSELLDVTHKVSLTHSYMVGLAYEHPTLGSAKILKNWANRTGGSLISIGHDDSFAYFVTVEHVYTNADVPDDLIYDLHAQIQKNDREKKMLSLPENETVEEFGDRVTVMGITTKAYFTYEGKKYELSLIDKDHARDTALLKIPLEGNEELAKLTSPRFGNSNDVHIGNFVSVTGHPLDLSKEVLTGYVSGTSELEGEIEGVQKKYFHRASASIVFGNSGGGVFALRDGDYELIGLSSMTANQAADYFIKIDAIKGYMQENELGFLLE